VPVTPWTRLSADTHVPPMCPAVLHASLHRRPVPHKGGEPACRPGSVPPLARGGGHPSRAAVADSLVRSTREHRAGRPRSLAQGTTGSPLDLAPGGVYLAAAVTCGAGGLLHRRFTLTPRTRRGAVCFLWHCPAGHPGSALPTTLPCGARTFLTGPAPGAAARPTHPYSGYAERRLAGVAPRLVPPQRQFLRHRPILISNAPWCFWQRPVSASSACAPVGVRVPGPFYGIGVRVPRAGGCPAVPAGRARLVGCSSLPQATPVPLPENFSAWCDAGGVLGRLGRPG
jgi:hypothetical protein